MTEVTSYTELIEGIKGRLGELGIRYEDFDTLASFPDGLSGKVFGILQVKRLGPEKLFDALRAAALRIRIEPDLAQLAKLQKQIAEKCQVRQANQSRPGHASTTPSSAVLTRVFKAMGRNGGKARWAGKSKKERSEHMKMMVLKRELKRRERKRRNAAHRRRRRNREAGLGSQQAGA